MGAARCSVVVFPDDVCRFVVGSLDVTRRGANPTSRASKVCTFVSAL